MKKLVFALFAVLLFGSASAQDHEKAYKKARKLLADYNIDSSKKEKLSNAREKVDYALTGDLSAIKNPYEPYLVKGNIYNAISYAQNKEAELAKNGLGELTAGSNMNVVSPTFIAFEALTKAIELGTKGSHKKKALNSLKETQQYSYNEGYYSLEGKKYEDAFTSFDACIKAHDVLKSNSTKSTLDADSSYNTALYLYSFAGANAEKYDEIKPSLIYLYEKEFDQGLIYSLLYNIESKENPEEAYKYIQTGRKLFPDDSDILIAEINHFLNVGKLDELIDKLTKAIELTPTNISLYTTLANVYDQLHQKEVEAGNTEKAQEYFDLALVRYNEAIEKDPKNADAHYSIGALYFNKAAAVNGEMMKLANDYSKAATKKYDALKQESLELFKKALPHFKKAESTDPNNTNTLIALKEIFAKTDDIEKSNEFKARLQVVTDGGSNPTSYFSE